MTSSQHGPDILGYTHATMAVTMGCELARGSESHKRGLSSDWRLQPASMKLELLVTVGQHTTVNTFPGLVHTARHITKAGCTRSGCANSQGKQVTTVWFVIGVKS